MRTSVRLELATALAALAAGATEMPRAAKDVAPVLTIKPRRDGMFDDYSGPNPPGQNETAKVAVERRAGPRREELRRWARAHGKTLRQVMADPALLAEVRP